MADESQTAVLPKAGAYRSGLIEGVSLIAKGEALGHEMWIDDVTLAQVAEFANRGNNGVKSRFTHPGMSSDGLGRHLGRVRDVWVEGDKVVGDLHFSKSAHDTPDGNLADYVMSLTMEDPAAAGLSIVFEHDYESEMSFIESHQFDNEFQSPDPDNVNNYPHVRLAGLRAADVVDEPAANPDGMFDRQDLPRHADAFLCYLAGLTDDKPLSCFGVDPDRAKEFLSRWLENHQYCFTSRENPDVNDNQTPEPTPAPSRDDFVAELNKYTDAFGADHGTEWFQNGDSFEQALQRHADLLAEENKRLIAELAEAQEKLADVKLGEVDPVEVTDKPKKKSVFRFADGGPPSDN